MDIPVKENFDNNIFGECFSHIVDTKAYENNYIEKYGYCRNTNLSLKEAHDLYILCKTANNNDFHFSRGFYPGSDTICIF